MGVGTDGVKPAASALTGRCSDRLNYNPRKRNKTEINGLLEGYLRHFSANQPEGLELLDVAQCCYKLTTKKLCVELQPLRVGHGATASDAPHHCGRRRLAHQPTFLPRRGRSATT
ncbi:hypothetical protein HKD37_10G028323 [Glycine soja]